MLDLNKNAKTKCILVVVVKCRDRENDQLAVLETEIFLLLILQGLQKDDAASKTEGLFDAESTAYIKSVTYCGISIAVLVFIFLIYEIVTRKKRNPNAKRYGKTLF